MQTALTFDDVLLVPSYNDYTSRRDVDISMKDKTGKFELKLPIFTANMDTVTGSEMAKYISKKGGAGVIHRFMTIQENVNEFKNVKSSLETDYPIFVSVGASPAELERAAALYENGAQYFCVDVAHGHAKYVGKMIKEMRIKFRKNTCIMAGNVCTYAGADYLASCGADVIKVGIGPGAVCTTRIKTGFGVPQLKAIQDCSKVDRSIVADGGLKSPGDIVKALAFGADFVMIGSMLAGTRPTPGKVEFEPGNPYSRVESMISKLIPTEEQVCDAYVKKFKTYRGMASKEVAEEHHGGLAEWKTAEGVSTKVPYREDEDAIIADIVGGLRSGLTYAGSATIKEMQRKLNYVEVTPAGRVESLPHRTL